MTQAPGLVVVRPQEGREVLALGNTHRNKGRGLARPQVLGRQLLESLGGRGQSSRRGPDRDKLRA